LALATDVLAEQIDVTEDDERRWQNWSSLVLNDENVALELPQQVGDCVRADEDGTAHSSGRYRV